MRAARHTAKTTKNIGKLMQEAVSLRARFAVIVEGPQGGTVKDLTTNMQDASPMPIAGLAERIAQR